jgi:hypothetical protein
MRNRVYLSLVLVAVMCLAGWTGYGQGQRSNPARQAWEYKTLVFTIEAFKNTLHEDGKPLPAASSPITRAGEIGAQGWELVSVAATESERQTTFVYWFKRPK